MHLSTLMQLLHTFKGAPLSTLIAIYHTQEPMTAIEIATVTGYDRKSIGEALKKLEIAGYITTTPGKQWVLGSTEVWGEILPTSSSSGYNHESTYNHDKPVGVGRDSPHTDPATTQLIYKFGSIVTNSARAEKSITAALNRGLSVDQVEAQIDDWLTYCASPAGSSIKAPGFFIAKKLLDGEPPPPRVTTQTTWYNPDEAELIQR
jgi:hypothetical protein